MGGACLQETLPGSHPLAPGLLLRVDHRDQPLQSLSCGARRGGGVRGPLDVVCITACVTTTMYDIMYMYMCM